MPAHFPGIFIGTSPCGSAAALFTALLALAIGSAATANTPAAPPPECLRDRKAWTRVLGGEIPPDFTQRTLAIDVNGAISILECRKSRGKAPTEARIRTFPGKSGETPASPVQIDGIPISKTGARPALLAWRNWIYLADCPEIRIFPAGPKSNARSATVAARFLPAKNDASQSGFGGLVPGPDGRIYGSFSGGSVKADGTETRNGVIFRFEPDGSGFEIVERGLSRPSAPMFDDFDMATLIDRGPGNHAFLAPMLDGGAAGAAPPPKAALSFPPILPGPAALTKPESTSGLAIADNAIPPRLAWWTRNENGPLASGTLDSGFPREKAIPVDLASDWNGRPHLLLRLPSPDGGPGRFEVLALGPDPENHGKSIEALEEINRHLADPARDDGGKLVGFLDSSDRAVRLSAALAITRHTEALGLLAQALGSAPPRTRLHAIWATGILARRGAAATVPGDDTDFSSLPNDELARNAAKLLAPFLDNPDPRLRIQALRALAAGRRSAGLVQFPKLLADPNPQIRTEALLAAARMRWRAMSTSLSSMQRANKMPDLDPARIADVLDHTYSPAQLRIFTRSRTPILRLAAVESLRRARSPHLKAFLSDPDPAVSSAASKALLPEN